MLTTEDREIFRRRCSVRTQAAYHKADRNDSHIIRTLRRYSDAAYLPADTPHDVVWITKTKFDK